MALRCVLWDFGNTLVDQDWMLTPHQAVAEWPEVWTAVARSDLEATWCLGEMTCEDMAHRISEQIGLSVADTMAHIRYCCSNIRFFEAAIGAARRCSLPQAIVTVNPDVFTRFVVPHYQLDALFPVIVTSWQERTLDKAELCARAVARLNETLGHDEALLIDNIEPNVRAWEAGGGVGYVFVGEAQFAADLQTTLQEVVGDSAR
jgi:beta-phosphoglucomutase-like phosphatase (HAD superfamily)